MCSSDLHIVHTRLGFSSPSTLLNLLYTTNGSGAWITTAIQSGTVKGADASIAVDRNGFVHICCSNEEGTGSPSGPSGGLRYVTNSTGIWTWQDVDPDPHAGHDTDIAVDPWGSVHISYLNSEAGLGYATNRQGFWEHTILDSTPNVGWNTSIGTDCRGRVHISYSDPGPILDPPGQGRLMHVSNDSGEWITEVVDDSGAGYYTGLDIDDAGAVRIAYLEILPQGGQLNLATLQWGTWHLETVSTAESPGDAVGIYCAIDLDREEKPHICHYDYANQTLLYTTDRSRIALTPDLPSPRLCRKPPHSRTDNSPPESLVSDFSNLRPLKNINSPCPEDAIEISADGSTLYYMFARDFDSRLCTQRLLSFPSGTHVSRRQGNPDTFVYSNFFDLGKGIDYSFDAELSFSPDGSTVYFHSLRATNTGFQQDPPTEDFLDIYTAPIIDGIPGPAVNLGPPINSPYPDGEHAIHPDGVTLYFTSLRPAGLGGSNIWSSTRIDGTWSDPLLLSPPINSDSNDLQPFFAEGGQVLFFVSDRDGGNAIYRSEWSPSGWGIPEVVIRGNVGEPSLTADGMHLYFVHVLIDEEEIGRASCRERV